MTILNVSFHQSMTYEIQMRKVPGFIRKFQPHIPWRDLTLLALLVLLFLFRFPPRPPPDYPLSLALALSFYNKQFTIFYTVRYCIE
jgi:hypothetical protein